MCIHNAISTRPHSMNEGEGAVSRRGENVTMASSLIKDWWNSYQMKGQLSKKSNTQEDKEEFGRKTLSMDLNQALRTRQLVINLDGNQPILSLRAPLDLVNFPSISCLRWPTECEVIGDTIHHIEWDPPQPEPFYQQTGRERMPLPTGDERGKVVYSMDQSAVPQYFTCSRVGGSPSPIKNATCFDIKLTDLVLEFESRFESGNLHKAVQVGPFDYELTIRCDMYTKKHTQWFYFRVKNMKAGVTYRFTIVNMMKSSSLYSYGMKPLLYSERSAKESGVGWQRTGFNIRYYRNLNQNMKENETKSLYCLTWSLQFPYESDTCFMSHCYPYTYSHLQHYLQRISTNPNVASYCKLRILCHSLAGNAVYMMTITSNDNKCEERAKRAVVVTARVHPGETNGSWMMEGFLDFLLGNSEDAQLLRDMFVFKIVPMLNPDGVIVGNYRCSLAGRDLNRNYKTCLKDAFPCVWHTRKMVEKLLTETDVVLYCDFHGHNRKNNAFMYGCNSQGDASTNLYERVFPLMMSKNANNTFSFKSCKFRVQKSKEGTGRITMWRLGIRNSYTMEATFGGSTLGDRRGTHFSTRDLKSLGFGFCDTLLDYCDPDPSKTNYCLTELMALMSEQVKERLGRDFTDSNVKVSDLETSTSGSNSTDSDGPPMHLLNRPTTPQKKRKCLKSRRERNRLHTEPKVQDGDSKDMDSDLPHENTTKARCVIQENKNQVTKLSKKLDIPPVNTHPGKPSQVTLWQGLKPVVNNCDMRLSHYNNRNYHLNSNPTVQLHRDIAQWRSPSQFLHLSAILPPQTDCRHFTQRLCTVPRQRAITYVSRGFSSIPVPDKSPGEFFFKMVPNICDRQLATCLSTEKCNNDHIYKDTSLLERSSIGQTTLKPQHDKFEGVSVLKCTPCNDQQGPNVYTETFFQPLQKSSDKRQGKGTSKNRGQLLKGLPMNSIPEPALAQSFGGLQGIQKVKIDCISGRNHSK
uniref:Cytosolic carboxypeptidase 2 n=1 Tax=Knipowitschia caucasica TaxID=637954 RepID=A0AAV2L5L7_KNICA